MEKRQGFLLIELVLALFLFCLTVGVALRLISDVMSVCQGISESISIVSVAQSMIEGGERTKLAPDRHCTAMLHKLQMPGTIQGLLGLENRSKLARVSVNATHIGRVGERQYNLLVVVYE